MWSPPDPYEPTSELYRLMPPRRPADDDPLIDLTLPRQPWWRELTARAKPASRRAAVWVWGVATGVLILVIYGWLSSH